MMNRELPAPVAALMRRLRAGGYTAWAVGGCVRDLLRGQQPHDWDVTTSALPPQVHEALSGVRVVDTGVSYGTVTALTDLGPVEITTYRLDGAYSDRRRPDGVAFTDRLEDDLARRDFTVNAMAWDGETLIDPFGGRRDLERGLLRAVGAPAQRFEEDALRILRALRFASTIGFDIEPETADALRSRKELLTAVAAERVREELSRLLCGHPVPVLRAYADVVAVVLPELVPTFGFDQRNRHHLYDVWEHTLHALDSAPEDAVLRWALLLHDCGKPAAFSMGEDAQGHFYGHAAESARIARGTLERLRFDRAGRERILRLIALHDHDLPATPVAVRRWLLRLPPEELRLLIALKRADNAGQHPAWRHDEQWLRAAELLTEIEARDGVPSLARLAVNGQDLQGLGLRGSEIGRMLDRLLEATVDGLPNERAALLAEAQRLLAE